MYSFFDFYLLQDDISTGFQTCFRVIHFQHHELMCPYTPNVLHHTIGSFPLHGIDSTWYRDVAFPYTMVPFQHGRGLRNKVVQSSRGAVGMQIIRTVSGPRLHATEKDN